MEHRVAWIRYQHRHSPMSQRKKGCQLFLLLAVTPHKGKRRTETTSEDRRQEGCQSHDKGRTQRMAREVSSLQLWMQSHQRPEVWAWLAGQGQWLCSWRVLTPLSPSFIPTSGVADCISERTLNLIAQINLKSCSSCWKDLTEALRGKIRKGKKRLFFVRMHLAAGSYRLLSHQGLLLIKILSGRSL